MKKHVLRPLLVFGGLLGTLMICLWFLTLMPGSVSHVLERELTAEEATTRVELRNSVEFLASGPRNAEHGAAHAKRVTAVIERELRAFGFEPSRQLVEAPSGPSYNIIARREGTTRPEEIVVIGAHWDTRGPTPGADDNASGVAALLDLSKWLASQRAARTLEIAFWTNEEPPHFQTEFMGSLVHARGLKNENANVVQMLSLEMLGYYDATVGAQKYPAVLSLFYPEHGAFVAFVGSMWHRGAVTNLVGAMREHSDFPTYGFAGPEAMPGIGFSDQWSFWQVGYPGAMLTDTSFFRTPHYHQLSDTPETLDYDRYARVVVALRPVVLELLN